VAILFIYIFKNDENLTRTQKFFHFFENKIQQVCEIWPPKKKTIALD
jgi:hypothetical protein